MKRCAALVLAVFLTLGFSARAAADKIVTMTFVGDCTLGSEESQRGVADSFDNIAKKKGYEYFFAKFYDLFSQDDCTVVNCNGVLSDNREGEVKSKNIRYRGVEKYAEIFRAGSVELVSLANNHANDYSAKGLQKTKNALEAAGIGWAMDEDFFIFEKDGIRIAFVSFDYGIFKRSNYKLRDKLLKMEADGEINAAVMLIHEGREYAPKHVAQQDAFAEYFIENAGADLAIMHQAHVVQGVRILNNRSIFYSLGNFVFGGQQRLPKAEKANALYCLVVQAKMYFSDDGEYQGQQVLLYPAYESGTNPKNNFQPVRLNAKDAEPVLAAVQDDTEWPLPAIQTDADGYAYVVLNYLPATEETENVPETNGDAPPAAPARPTRDAK